MGAAALRRVVSIWLAVAGVGGCSPALDWREFTPEGSGVVVTFPCRTDRHARPVAFAGETLHMEMLVCSAADATYAVSFFDVADPARLSAVVAEWRETAVRNVQGTDARRSAWVVKGMTPNDQAGRLVVAGRLPDGSPVQEHAAFFVHGLRVYSATVLGAKPSPEAVETFFRGLKFPV